MANTFTMIGPSGVYPGQAQPQMPQYANLSPQSQPTPTGAYTPINPLPGALGPSSTPL